MAPLYIWHLALGNRTYIVAEQFGYDGDEGYQILEIKDSSVKFVKAASGGGC